MRKFVKYLCFTSGIVLIVAALSLVLYNIKTDMQSGERAEEITQKLSELIPESTEPQTTVFLEKEEYDLFAEYEESQIRTDEEKAESIPTAEIDGRYYIGLIEFPTLSIELPILKNWSYPNLQLAPCRYEGTFEDNDIIIAAHNYRSHFGRIGSLNTDDEIIIHDISGNIRIYNVIGIEQIRGTDIERMDFGSAEEWDLTLFTCTIDGQSRVTVRAVLMEGGDKFE